MASETHGSILLSTADSVSRMLMKKLDSETGFKPSEWTDNINLLGALPIRTASGTIVHFEDGADDVPMKSVVANIVPFQSGTGTPSPSNPRPISGMSVLNVTRCGKNLFDPSTEFSSVGSYLYAKSIFPKDTTLICSFTDKDPTVDISGKYFGFMDDTYISGGAPSGHYRWLIDNGNVQSNLTNITTTSIKCDGLFAYPQNQATIDTLLARFNIQIEVGSTPTTYEPYNAETYTFDLGQEIMGGSADVVEGTGEETHGIVDLGDLTWTYRTDVLGVPCFLSNDISDIKNGSLPIACSCLEIKSPNRTAIDGNYQVSIGNNTNAKYLVIRYDEYTDGTAVKTALTGQNLVYELATPTDFTFTGQPINSYLGVNNLYTDSGEVLDVEYRADMNLLIAELEG